MARTVKRQVGFYADQEIEKYLESLEPGVKGRVINAALRAWMLSRHNLEEPAYNDSLDSLMCWLTIQLDPIVVGTQSGQTISLAALLHKFLHQDRLRERAMTWPDVVSRGLTFPSPPHLEAPVSHSADGKSLLVPASADVRCASCQKPLYDAQEAINTPTRGKVCRACFELPVKHPSEQVVTVAGIQVLKDTDEEEDMERIRRKR